MYIPFSLWAGGRESPNQGEPTTIPEGGGQSPHLLDWFLGPPGPPNPPDRGFPAGPKAIFQKPKCITQPEGPAARVRGRLRAEGPAATRRTRTLKPANQLPYVPQ